MKRLRCTQETPFQTQEIELGGRVPIEYRRTDASEPVFLSVPESVDLVVVAVMLDEEDKEYGMQVVYTPEVADKTSIRIPPNSLFTLLPLNNHQTFAVQECGRVPSDTVRQYEQLNTSGLFHFIVNRFTRVENLQSNQLKPFIEKTLERRFINGTLLKPLGGYRGLWVDPFEMEFDKEYFKDLYAKRQSNFLRLHTPSDELFYKAAIGWWIGNMLGGFDTVIDQQILRLAEQRQLSEQEVLVLRIIHKHVRDEARLIRAAADEAGVNCVLDLCSGHGQGLLRGQYPVDKSMVYIGMELDKTEVAIGNEWMDHFLSPRRARIFHGNVLQLIKDISENSIIHQTLEIHPHILLSLLQNSLGTLRKGSSRGAILNTIRAKINKPAVYASLKQEHKRAVDEFLGQINVFFRMYPQSQFLLSLYRADALPGFGLDSYKLGEDFNGWPPYDPALEDNNFVAFSHGDAYFSHWWTDEEIREIVNKFAQAGVRLSMHEQTDKYWVGVFGR